jgi:hypothetical protein
MSETLQFKTFCIEQYKYEHNMTGAATLNLFQKYGVLDYLTSFFDVLHTTGAKYIVQDIDEYISNRQ